MNDEVSTISSQTAEQIEIIPGVVLSKVSKLIDSVTSRRQREQRKHRFLVKKGSIKQKIDSLLTNN